MTMDSDVETSEPGADPTRQAAARLGAVAFALMGVLALWLFAIAGDHPWREATIFLLATYSALIIAFVGGIRWGAAFLGDQRSGRALEIGFSLVPVLVGWSALLLQPPYSFAILAVAFAAQGAWDALAVHREDVPQWFGTQRNWLTALSVFAMIVAFAATA